MMNKLMNFRKNKKGFTLVEIIVVLVILAILAAIAIPSMLGFVNQSKDQALIAEARTAYLAGQLEATKTGGVTAKITALAKDATKVINPYLDREATKVGLMIATDDVTSGTTTVKAGTVLGVYYAIDSKYVVTQMAFGTADGSAGAEVYSDAGEALAAFTAIAPSDGKGVAYTQIDKPKAE